MYSKHTLLSTWSRLRRQCELIAHCPQACTYPKDTERGPRRECNKLQQVEKKENRYSGIHPFYHFVWGGDKTDELHADWHKNIRPAILLGGGKVKTIERENVKRLNQLANAVVLFVCSRRRWSSFPGYLLLLRPSVTSVAQWPLVEAAEPVRMAFHYSSTDNNRSIYVLFLRQVTGDPEQLSSQPSNYGGWVGGFGVWTASSRRRRKNEEVAPEKEERTGAIRPISLYTASIYSHIANWKIALQGESGSRSLVYWWQEGRNTQIDNASRRKDNELGTQSRSPLTDWLAQANWNFTNVSRTTTKSTTFRIGCILGSIHVSG